MYTVYILYCAANVQYVGYTSDLQARLKAHWSGNGAQVTRDYSPIYHKVVGSYRTVALAKLVERSNVLLLKARGIKAFGAGWTASSY